MSHMNEAQFRHAVSESVRDVLEEYKEVHREEDFRDKVRWAFQMVGAQLAAVLFISVIYFNFVMIRPYFTAFFWALAFSVVVRHLKGKMASGLAPLKTIEKKKAASSSGCLSTAFAKFQFLWSSIFLRILGSVFVGALFCKLVVCGVLGRGCWVPHISIIILVALSLLVVSIVFSLCSSSSVDNVLSVVIVLLFIVLFAVIVSLFVVKSVQETREFVAEVRYTINHTEFITDEDTNEFIRSFLQSFIGEFDDAFPDLTAAFHLDEFLEEDEDLDWFEEELFDQKIFTQNSTFNSNSAGLDPKTAIRKAEQFLHDSDFGAASDFFQENSGVIFQVVDGIVKSLKAVLVAIIRLVRHALRTVVFFGALMFLVSCESDPIDTIFRVIPVVSRKQTELSDRIKHNISQILIVSILLCAWRGFVTWVYFVVLDLQFPYCVAFLNAPTAVFPISPWVIFAPALLITYFRSDPYWLYYAVGILIAELLIVRKVSAKIEKLVPDSSPYLTGIGLLLGVGAFGPKGILIGPMLILLLRTLFHLFHENVASPSFPRAQQPSTGGGKKKKK